jgi:addiction module HigA family antidote
MTNGASVSSGKMATPSASASLITTDELLHNPHAGEALAEDFLKPLGISQTALAKAIGVSPRRINEIILGKRAVTANTDLRLARYFGVSEGFFLGLQMEFELMEERRVMSGVLASIIPRRN